MSLMKAKDQLIHIPLYYMEKEVRGYTKIIILEDDKAKKLLAEQEEDKKKKTKKEIKDGTENKTEEKVEEKEVIKVECLNTYWKLLNWKEQNQISKMSQVQSATEMSVDIDYFKLRDLRIKMCLKKWDLKDEEGNEVPVKPESVDSLPAEVVYTLSSKYDTLITLSEDEIKNL